MQTSKLNFKHFSWSGFLWLIGFFLFVIAFTGLGTNRDFPPNTEMPLEGVGTEEQVGDTSEQLESMDRIVDWDVGNESISDPVKLESTGNDSLEITAKSAIAVSDSGAILYSKNENDKLLPASTVKIMTALVVLNEYDLGALVSIPPICTELPGNNMGLISGDVLKLEDLLYGLLVFSGSDAACALYNYKGNTQVSFTEKMNEMAAAVGMENTYFSNPIGFDDLGNGNYTTSKDLAKLANVAMRDGVFRKIVGTREVTLKSAVFNKWYSIRSTNDLLRSIPGIIGIKTGFTENAGGNLVTAYETDGHEIIIVVMGSRDRFLDTRKIIDWIAGNYQW